MGDVTISEQLLRDLIDKLGEAATAGMATASAVTASTAASEKRQESIMAALGTQAQRREQSVEDVKSHISDQVKMANRWPTILLGILAAFTGVIAALLARHP